MKIPELSVVHAHVPIMTETQLEDKGLEFTDGFRDNLKTMFQNIPSKGILLRQVIPHPFIPFYFGEAF